MKLSISLEKDFGVVGSERQHIAIEYPIKRGINHDVRLSRSLCALFCIRYRAAQLALIQFYELRFHSFFFEQPYWGRSSTHTIT